MREGRRRSRDEAEMRGWTNLLAPEPGLFIIAETQPAQV